MATTAVSRLVDTKPIAAEATTATTRYPARRRTTRFTRNKPFRAAAAGLRLAALSAFLGLGLALPTAERDPAEQQHPRHIRAAADVDRCARGLDHLVGGRAVVGAWP